MAPRDSTTTLLPCPFCGGEAGMGEAMAGPWRPQKWFWVNCCECLASTNQLTGESARFTAEEAIAAWNQRVCK